MDKATKIVVTIILWISTIIVILANLIDLPYSDYALYVVLLAGGVDSTKQIWRKQQIK